MAEFTPSGIVIERFDEIRTRLEDRYRDAFGSDIRTDAASKYGLQINIMAEILEIANEQVLEVSSVFDPDQASDAILSRLVKLNGIEREDDEFSTTVVRFTGDNGVAILQGTQVRVPNSDVNWATTAASVIAGGIADVTVRADVAGPISVSANTITEIVNAILGVDSVTNPSDSTLVLGQDRESDTNVRIRRDQVAKSGGSGSVDRIASRLFELPDVTDVKVVENVSGAALPNAQPDSTINAIVLGGADTDIARVLGQSKAGGMPTWSATSNSADYVSPVTGQTYPQQFDRPTVVQIYINVEITTFNDFPSTGVQQIKDAILALSLIHI